MRFRWVLRVMLLPSSVLVLAASAHGATPPTMLPIPQSSLASGLPRFAWVTGPIGESVGMVRISRAADLSTYVGGGVRITPRLGAGFVRPSRPLGAGRWYWNAVWTTPPDIEPFEHGNTPIRSFQVPAYVARLTASYLMYGERDDMSVVGSFVTNVAALSVTCTVRHGSRVLSREVDAISFVSVGRRMNYACRTLRVPEQLDGATLRLTVTVRGGGRSASLASSLTAR